MFGNGGVVLDDVYTAKAAAALVADVRAGRAHCPLLWNTTRGTLPPPDAAWKDRLPHWLRDKIENWESEATPP